MDQQISDSATPPPPQATPEAGLSFKIRTSYWLVLFKIVFIELLFLGLNIILSLFSPETPIGMLTILIFEVVKLLIVFYIFLSWYYSYYIISQQGILNNNGIIFRTTVSIDLGPPESVHVKQYIIFKPFNFGNLVVEGSETITMKNIEEPYLVADLINREWLNKTIVSPDEKALPMQ